MIPSCGDVLESAIWLDGTETVAERARFANDVAEAMRAWGRRHGREIGPVTWIEKRPGDDRVPPVPDHIAGPNVRLLVAEAMIVTEGPIQRAKVGFVDDLEPSDAALLRRVTRRAYRRQYPNRRTHPDLTDRQCDTLINDLGPDAAVETLRGLRPSDLH